MRMCRGKVCSEGCMSKGVVLVTLFCFLELKYCEVMEVCMCLRFAQHSSAVMSDFEMIMLECSLLWNIVAFMFLGGFGCALRWCSGCDGVSVNCLSWVAWSLRCVFIGRTLVSSCKCCVFVSLVQPVAMRRAVFWMT